MLCKLFYILCVESVTAFCLQNYLQRTTNNIEEKKRLFNVNNLLYWLTGAQEIRKLVLKNIIEYINLSDFVKLYTS